MRILPWIAKKWLILFVVNATVLGGMIDFVLGNKIDYWVHDAAVVFQARTEWKYAAIVVLDNDVPIQVGRKQALPLFARATEKVIAAGAKGVFLDARVPKEIEGIMPYALCFEQNGKVRWSEPECQVTTQNQCELRNSLAGNAPLKMRGAVFPYFRIAPYLSDSTNLPDFLLYDWESEAFIPETGLVASDRLVTKNSPINRWIDLSEEHAVITMAKFMNAEKVTHSLRFEDKEVCDHGVPCRRIRLTRPYYDIQFSSKQPIIPVSRLASCDDRIAEQAALALKDRVVILQLTTPSEATDMLITPMTSALLGPHLLTPGAQFLADAVETLLNNDHPREPYRVIKLSVFFIAALLSVYAGAYLRQSWLLGIGSVLLLTMSALCFFSPLQQLWPVTATLLTFVAGSVQIIGIHLIIGFREGKLITQYMPKQVHHMLLSLKEKEVFQSRRY
jgi:adenylate cyclase